MIRIGRRPDTAPRPARSRWAAGGCRSPGPGSARATGPGSGRCRPELFSSTELLGRMAMERMLAGVSTRHYPVALEPVGEQVEADAEVDQQVGRVAEVRGDDQDRAGRSAGRRFVRAGPG